MEAFDDDVPQDEIIDEEELIMLKDMKDLKREYRDNYSQLKGLKSDLVSLQKNIDASKEQLIYQFEQWYAETFEQSETGNAQITRIDIDQIDRQGVTSKGGAESTTSGLQMMDKDDGLEDEDAAVYRRAKQSVDELHRARKFEKSIKLR